MNNDLDGDGISNETEQALSEVPLVNRATGYVQLTTEDADLYRTPEASPRKVPTTLTVPEEGLDPNNPNDAAQDFDGDNVSNADEINDGTNPFVATSTGTFDDAVTLSLDSAASPEEAALGDLDEDGILDLVVVTESFQLEVFRGLGDGGFQFVTGYAVCNSLGGNPINCNSASGAVLADFNADGLLDVSASASGGNYLTVFTGLGDGTFGADGINDMIEIGNSVSYPVVSTPPGVVTGDFNGDGNLDLASTNFFDPADPNVISVLLNQGDGTFAPKNDFPVGRGPYGLITGDLDLDGNLDLATVNSTDGNLGVLLGVGDGTFQPQTTFPLGDNPLFLIAGDFDGDGDLDVAATNTDSHEIHILKNNGNGVFSSFTTFPSGDPAVQPQAHMPGGIVTADLNGNGNLDLVIANSADDQIAVFMGQGDGNFQFSEVKDVGVSPQYPALGDLDNDGDLDLVVTHNGGADYSTLINL